MTLLPRDPGCQAPDELTRSGDGGNTGCTYRRAGLPVYGRSFMPGQIPYRSRTYSALSAGILPRIDSSSGRARARTSRTTRWRFSSSARCSSRTAASASVPACSPRRSRSQSARARAASRSHWAALTPSRLDSSSMRSQRLSPKRTVTRRISGIRVFLCGVCGGLPGGGLLIGVGGLAGGGVGSAVPCVGVRTGGLKVWGRRIRCRVCGLAGDAPGVRGGLGWA